MTLTVILVVANFFFLLLTVIGGYFVLRGTVAKAEQAVQLRVREALSVENALLQSRIERIEADNKQLKTDGRLQRALMHLLVDTLKTQLGLDVEIGKDNTVIIRNGKAARIVRLSDEDTS